jgi:hypothetical protein
METKNNYPEIVNIIHNEFKTAGDKILKSSIEIIEQNKTENKKALIEKANRLASLGFRNTKEAVEGFQVIKEELMTKTSADLVEYYNRNYPLNKFIDENNVSLICKKYGLVCGNISDFTGFVPEAKLKEIENFKLRKEDKAYAVMIDRNGRVLMLLKQEDLILDNWEQERIKEKECYFLTTDMGIDNYTHRRLPKRLHYMVTDKRYVKVHGNLDLYAGLKICAPIKDMKIENMILLDGYKLVSDPDPVVLQPVIGGYLIVSAWGDEASDDIIINPVQN